MNAIELLTQQLQEAHQVFLGTVDGVTDEQANFQPEGKALSIAAVWIHHVESEDWFISSISGKDTVEATTFKDNTGFATPQPMADWAEAYPKWAEDIRADTNKLMAYTKAVFAASEAFVPTLNEVDLATTHQMGQMGESQTSTVLGGYVIGHCSSITGEISAIKGIQGLKGYPF